MSAYVRVIYDKLDFIEFKQNILFLKPPQHKAEVFNKLTLDEFVMIREFTKNVETLLNHNEVYNIRDYEKKIFELWVPVRSYPSASNLIAKALLSDENYNKLFQNNN